MPKLTKRTVDALHAKETDFIVFDDEVMGFGVRILRTVRRRTSPSTAVADGPGGSRSGGTGS